MKGQASRTNIPIETQPTRPIFIDLALATANALECPECPQRLKDALTEVATELIDHLSDGDTVFELPSPAPMLKPAR